MIRDPIKKVRMVNNKSLANPASTNKNVPSYGVVMVLECTFREIELYSLNDFISLMGGTYKYNMHLMKSPM